MRLFDFFEELSMSNSIPELTAECGVMSSGEVLDSSRGLGILIAFVWTYKLLLFFSLSTITLLVDKYVTGGGASFYGHFDGHIMMHSRRWEHRSIAKIQCIHWCPERWLSRLSALALVAERPARIFCVWFFRFWLVVLCLFFSWFCHKIDLPNSTPCVQYHKTRNYCKLRIGKVRHNCSGWFQLQFGISDAARA